MLTVFFAPRWCSVDVSESSMKISLLDELLPVDRRGGQGVGGRREKDPVRKARRKQSGQRGRGAGLVGVRRVCVHASGWWMARALSEQKTREHAAAQPNSAFAYVMHGGSGMTSPPTHKLDSRRENITMTAIRLYLASGWVRGVTVQSKQVIPHQPLRAVNVANDTTQAS